jgi:hypothetical protein
MATTKTTRITVKPFIGGGFQYQVGMFVGFGFATREAARAAAEAFRVEFHTVLTGEAA